MLIRFRCVCIFHYKDRVTTSSLILNLIPVRLPVSDLYAKTSQAKKSKTIFRKGGSYENKILYKNLKFFDKCRQRFRNATYGEKSC